MKEENGHRIIVYVSREYRTDDDYGPEEEADSLKAAIEKEIAVREFRLTRPTQMEPFL